MDEPHNYFTKKAYKGSNVVVLEDAMEENGWSDAAFMTRKQATDNDITILPRSQGTVITRWFPIKTKGKRRLGSKKDKLASVSYTIYNISQTSIAPPDEDEDEDEDDFEDEEDDEGDDEGDD